MGLTFAPMNREATLAVSGWRYPPPYDIYDGSQESVNALLLPSNYYFRIDRDEKLFGFCCFGPDGQVPGASYAPEYLDVGMGLRPDCTGQRLGPDALRATLALAVSKFRTTRFRATVAQFNVRAIQVCVKVGFRESEAFNRPSDGQGFAILLRDTPAALDTNDEDSQSTID